MHLVYYEFGDSGEELTPKWERHVEYPSLLSDIEWKDIKAHVPLRDPEEAKKIINECVGLCRELTSDGSKEFPRAAQKLLATIKSERQCLDRLEKLLADSQVMQGLRMGLTAQLLANADELARTETHLHQKAEEKRKFICYLEALLRRVKYQGGRPPSRECFRAVVSLLDAKWQEWTGNRLSNSDSDPAYKLVYHVCSTAAGRHELDDADTEALVGAITDVLQEDSHFGFAWDDLFSLMNPTAPTERSAGSRHVFFLPNQMVRMTRKADGSLEVSVEPAD